MKPLGGYSPAGGKSFPEKGFCRSSVGERIAHEDRVVALGAGRNRGHGALDQFLDPADVLDRLRREVGPAPRPGGALAPAVHLLVDRLAFRLLGGVRREVVDHLAAQPVAGANLERLEPVEHIELGQRDAGHARDRARLADEHRIEPAAAALAPGYRAELVAALTEPLAD